VLSLPQCGGLTPAPRRPSHADAPGFITGYVPAVVVYYLLNLAFPHHATLLAEAVTADEVDLTVPPTIDNFGTKSEEASKDAYEMGSISVHA
jgi:NCS1 family nucleobase:cation symporter-1